MSVDVLPRWTRALSFSLVTLILTLTAAPARAQAVSGELRLVVTGSAAIVFSVRDAAGVERHRVSAAADAVTTTPDLVPGIYMLALSGPAGSAASLRVRVGPREVVTVEARGEAGVLSAAVTDRGRRGEGESFDRALLQDLPVSQDVWTIVETAVPFAIADRIDTGGLGIGRSALMGGRGASWLSSEVWLDGQVVQDPGRTGRLDIAPDVAMLEAVDVMTGLAPVEVGTPGVVISLVPREPSSAAGAEITASATTPEMVGTNALAETPSVRRLSTWRHAGAVVDVPAGTRAGLLFGATFSEARYQEADPLGPERQARRLGASGRFVARVAPGQQVVAQAAGQSLRVPFDGRHQFVNDEILERARLAQGQVAWTRMTAAGGLVQIGGGFRHGRREPGITDVRGGAVDRLRDGILPAPPADITLRQADAHATWRLADRQWGSARHRVRLGGTWRRATRDASVVAAPAVAELVDGMAARLWVHEVPEAPSARRLNEGVVFVADRIDFGPDLTVEAGLRASVVSARATGAGQAIAWTTVSPRVSFRWRLGPLAVFGGYGRYAATHALSLVAAGDPGETWANVYRWRDASGDGLAQPDEVGELVARSGLGAAITDIDPDLRPPRTTQYTIGGEIRLGRHHTFQGSIIVRRQSDLVGLLNTGVGPDDYRTFEVLDLNADYLSPEDDRLLTVYDRLPAAFGQDAYRLANPDQARTTYGGIELIWRVESARWRMRFGATAYRTRGLAAHRGFGPLENDQHVLGEVYAWPNAQPPEEGSFFFDRSYVGKWSGSYHAPGGVVVGLAARYQDGQPFSRMLIVEDLSTGPDLLTAYRVGQTRYTYTLTLDVRFEKRFSAGRGDGAVHLDVFNLTNHRNEIGELVVEGPAFRVPTAVQPPRTLRVGFRFGF